MSQTAKKNDPEIGLFNGVILIDQSVSPDNEPDEFIRTSLKKPESNKISTIIERVCNLEKCLGIETGRYHTVKEMSGNMSPKTYANESKLKRHIRYKKNKKNKS